jgi:ribosomal protein L7Ae-like RNA K-turn-binding protein
LQYKSDAYKFERELRIVAPHQKKDNHSMGVRIPLKNINSLIRSVVIAPDADVSFSEAVSDLCKKYGLTAPIRRSKLSFFPT